MKAAGKLLFIALFALLIFISRTGNANGHAFPDHSDPKVGSTVSGAARVRIWFDGDLEPAFSTISVVDANGKKVDKGDSRVDASDATLLEVSLPPLSPGTYRVIWNVIARDGHKTEGDYSFTVK
ncbi:MAG TPA: copper resistance CopC family protein [Dissulfurispiraceae bacterium]